MKTIHRKLILGLSLSSLLASGSFAFDLKELGKRNYKGFEKPTLEYKVPDESTIPNNQFGDLIRYGKELTVHTYKYIGPEVEDENMRYAGNNLSCQACHLDAGTKAHSAPFVGTSAEFPQYRPRENVIGSIQDRINGCMQRSMNGKSLPDNSKEMKAFVAYTHWLSQGIPTGGANIDGRGLAKIDRKMIKQTKADVKNGEKVYAEHCASCHGDNGEGVKNEGRATGYTFPPLWGDDSYNDGAGMYRILKAADFIKSNMPLGATKKNPILTDKEAYDVAGYMNIDAHKRPAKANRGADFPDEVIKAPDVYRAGHPTDSKDAQFGPFGKIIK